MPTEPDHQHSVRRVTLPSGRSIEVVYFEPEPRAAGAAGAVDLHVCPRCAAELVFPLAWEEHDAVHWEVSLRCPNCEWHAVDLHTQEVVDRFDEALDRGTAALLSDLRRLTRANMEDEVARFSAALAADAILPEDF